MKNTKNPVKFWFLKNFLSPTMTVMINDFTSDPVNIAWSLKVWNLIISEELKEVMSLEFICFSWLEKAYH